MPLPHISLKNQKSVCIFIIFIFFISIMFMFFIKHKVFPPWCIKYLPHYSLLWVYFSPIPEPLRRHCWISSFWTPRAGGRAEQSSPSLVFIFALGVIITRASSPGHHHRGIISGPSSPGHHHPAIITQPWSAGWSSSKSILATTRRSQNRFGWYFAW